MIGFGSVIVCHENGWSCAKEAEFDFEIDPMPDKTLKKTGIINMVKSFDVIGEKSKNMMLQGVFKYDNGTKIAFEGILEGKERIRILGQLNNDFETILNKISQWQEQFKEN